MTATFEFTDRATPIVQMGRPEHLAKGTARWGRAHWGVGTWGRTSWRIVWSDVTCEIHEVTTDTGRNQATDRFKPATAEIVASNVNELTEFIFPELPPIQPLEFLPRPSTPSDTLPGELSAGHLVVRLRGARRQFHDQPAGRDGGRRHGLHPDARQPTVRHDHRLPSEP